MNQCMDTRTISPMVLGNLLKDTCSNQNAVVSFVIYAPVSYMLYMNKQVVSSGQDDDDTISSRCVLA